MFVDFHRNGNRNKSKCYKFKSHKRKLNIKVKCYFIFQNTLINIFDCVRVIKWVAGLLVDSAQPQTAKVITWSVWLGATP